MTFKKFEEIFLSKYPEGSISMHAKTGSSVKSHKVSVAFVPHGLVYEYFGAYEDVLCKMGFKVISKERLSEARVNLAHLKERHGKVCEFFGTHTIDNSKEIARLEAFLAEVEAEYIVA